MAYDLSWDSIFPSCLSEIDLLSATDCDGGCRKEESTDKRYVEAFNSWAFSLGSDKSHDDIKGKSENMSDDIADLLPTDPFGMDLPSTLTAIWSFGNAENEVKIGDDQLISGLHLVWNSAVMFHPEVVDMKAHGKSTESAMHEEIWDGLYDDSFIFNCHMDDFIGFSYEECVPSDAASEHKGDRGASCGVEEGVPHDALLLSLVYLGVRDLLSVERVCKSLYDAVRNDPLLWRSIHIDRPLSDRITDDDLLQLTNRAQGTLQCLILVGCQKITDSGLKLVLHSNPRLTKLSVPGCMRLSAEGILHNLKVFKSTGTPGIKSLRIGELRGITIKHFEELKNLLGADNKKFNVFKPRFYGGAHLHLSFDDDRALDIETCPRCQQLRQVYDCPAEGCQGKHKGSQFCRGCTLCIARCINCGCCINGCDYEETFCLDLLCLDCWKQLLNCQQMQEGVCIPTQNSFYHQQAGYHFCIYS